MTTLTRKRASCQMITSREEGIEQGLRLTNLEMKAQIVRSLSGEEQSTYQSMRCTSGSQAVGCIRGRQALRQRTSMVNWMKPHLHLRKEWRVP